MKLDTIAEFEKLDTDGDGYIDTNELRDVVG